MNGENKTCCFFGHRKISETNNLKTKLYEVIENLILYDDVNIFLFGSKSQFDTLCREIVSDLKQKHTHIKRIYVRAEYPDINDEYEKYLLEDFEETYYPPKIRNAGKAVYIERNCEMIDKSDICVVYFKNAYLPPKRKNSKNNLFDYQPTSGTSLAYQYAVRKKKKIINIT